MLSQRKLVVPELPSGLFTCVEKLMSKVIIIVCETPFAYSLPREQDATTCAVKVGDLVRVKPSVLKPHLGWGSVSHRSVGKIVALNPDRKGCTVDFPEQGGWMGLLEEMEVDTGHHQRQEVSTYCLRDPACYPTLGRRPTPPSL